MIALLLSLALQDLVEKKCDAAVTENADWCRTCDALAGDGNHADHDVFKATLCVRKLYTNGCCVRAEPGAG
jgi:hypothetical protein